MEDTEEEIDFANLIDMFDSSFYDEEDEENEIATLPKVKTIWKFITFCLIKINVFYRVQIIALSTISVLIITL